MFNFKEEKILIYLILIIIGYIILNNLNIIGYIIGYIIFKLFNRSIYNNGFTITAVNDDGFYERHCSKRDKCWCTAYLPLAKVPCGSKKDKKICGVNDGKDDSCLNKGCQGSPGGTMGQCQNNFGRDNTCRYGEKCQFGTAKGKYCPTMGYQWGTCI